MEERENIDIGAALLGIMEICMITECSNCPMFYLCYNYFKVDPCNWEVNSIPKLALDLEY